MLARRLLFVLGTTALASGVLLHTNVAHSAAKNAAVPNSQIGATRRTTESQYRHTIADIFGNDIQVNGRFEPEGREHLLLAIGSSMLSISAAGFEQYFSMGKGISDQVLSAKRRDQFVPCAPADPKAADDKCATAFINKYGRLLFRRPLTGEEVQPRVALAAAATTQTNDFYSGLRMALTSLLTAPQFLFRVETVELVDKKKDAWRLDGYSKAARLSYLMWDASPDEALLSAAAAGELHTQHGLEKQIDRLLASSRLEAGARAFFTDMLQLDKYESTTKDASIYPKFSQLVAESGKEQTLKTMVDLLVTKSGDYRDIFTSRDTFIDRSLASIYQVPYLGDGGWTPYTFADDSDRAGVLTQLTFLAVFSHPGRSSPTKRGVAINEIFQCIPTPTPPANVDFSIVNDTANPELKTVRARLMAHAEDESCSGCHIKSDALGLSLERFDSLAQPRLLENGAPIDVTSELDKKPFEGAAGLGKALRENAKVPMCLVRNVYAYGIGQEPGLDDRAYLETQNKQFAQDGYRLRTLLRRIASSPNFFKAPQSDSGVAPKVAQTH